MLQRLADEPVFLPIIHGDDVYHLPYTGRNAGIEREQSRGLFFEAMELEELRKVVKPGAHVVDVGANTGNHTIFFAGPMEAASVVPFEPLPAAAAALRASVERNALTNVDLSRLGRRRFGPGGPRCGWCFPAAEGSAPPAWNLIRQAKSLSRRSIRWYRVASICSKSTSRGWK